MKLSIIIINYGKFSYHYLDECLNSIYKNSCPSNFCIETIVVDNKSNEKEILTLKEMYSKASFHIFKKNLGFSQSVNYAAKIADGDYLLILNYDIILKQNTFEKIYSFLSDNNNDTFAVASLQLLNKDESVQFSKGKYPTIFRIFKGLFKPISERKWDTANYDKICSPDWVSGSAIIINHKTLNRSFLFDENYFMYYEDVDFCYCLKKMGRKILYLPDIKVYHTNPFHSRNNIDKNLFYEIRKSQLYFFFKNYGGFQFYILKLFSVTYIFLKLISTGILSLFFKEKKHVYNVFSFVLKKIVNLNFNTVTEKTNINELCAESQ